ISMRENGQAVATNLISAWLFDEGTGTSVEDDQKDNDGTISGASWYDLSTSPVVNGLLLDGTDDYVVCGNDSSLDIRNELTIELSLAIQTLGQNQYLISRGRSASAGYNWCIYIDSSDSICFYTPRGEITSGSTVISDKDFHHIVATYSYATNSMKLYVDGTQVSSTSINKSLPSISTNLTIGSEVGGGSFNSNVIFGDARIYNRALSSTEVNNRYNDQTITTGLVSSWLFDEGQGTTLYDTTGINNGTIYGSSWVKNSSPEDTIEFYVSGLMKRKTEGTTSDIYEYLDEDWNSRGYGRETLAYDATGGIYRTYTWSATQVTVEEYSGTYSPAAMSDVWDDVLLSERTATYIYDHHDVQHDLDTATNGWAMRSKTEYETNGTTVSAEYEYDTSGRLIKEQHSGDDFYFTYDYYTGDYSSEVFHKYEYGFEGDISLTAHGNVYKDTTAMKFGLSSAKFDGTGDYLTTGDSEYWDICASNTDSWTIDAWVKLDDTTGNSTVVSHYETYANWWYLCHEGTAGFAFEVYLSDSLIISAQGGQISDNNWHHVALCKNANTYGIYLDGQQTAYTQDDSTYNYSGTLYIGAVNGVTAFDGNMDEVRIVHNNSFNASPNASLTDTISVPTAAYTFDSGTVFLAHMDGSEGSTSFNATTIVETLIKTYEYDTSGNLVRIIYAQGSMENYDTSPFMLKRKIDSDTSDIYEYLNEDWNSQGYGRVTLLCDTSDGNYTTYDWNTPQSGQVTVNTYKGAYEVETGDSVRNDVIASERTDSFIYDHNGNQSSLDTATNGWVMRQHTVYATDGTTVSELYVYDSAGRLTSDSYASTDRSYTYTYDADDANRVEYKYEWEWSTSTLLNTYNYLTDQWMMKEVNDPGASDTGTIYTYIDRKGTMCVNTQLDADGTFTEYRYNEFDVLIGADRYNASRTTIWKLDADLNVIDTITPNASFAKGVNMPWTNYGYDLGIDQEGSTSHMGYSSDLEALVGRMLERQGDYMRVFLFNDLRSGVTFDGSGNPTGFTDKVYDDMDALVDVAEILGIKLIPVLLDFKMADNDGTGAKADHPDLITDSGKRSAFVSLMGDFVGNYSTSSSIYAWEVMNEPEEIIWNTSGISAAQVQVFVQAMVNEIHAEDSGSIVTLGSADRNALLNYWTGVGLDLYQFHYYNKFEDDSKPLAYDADLLNLDKPVIIGEVDPTTCEKYTDTNGNGTWDTGEPYEDHNSNGQWDNDYLSVIEKLTTIYSNNYAGALFWEDESDLYTISDEMYDDMKSWMYYGQSGERDETYDSLLLKRHTTAGGDIYEYLDEDWLSQGYGRITLTYDAYDVVYETYDWDSPATGQVTVEEYHGSYDPAQDSATRSDLVTSERSDTYIYDHNSEQVDLDTATNGWIMRKHTVYGSDGTTMAREYTYDSQGRMTRNEDVAADRYYLYTSYYDQTQYRYMEEYERSTDTLLATYEYDSSGNLINTSYGGDIVEWHDSGLMKRKMEDSTRNIYEYYDEDYFDPDTGSFLGYGRYSLIYNYTDTEYKTYDWGLNSVTVNVYEAAYGPAPLSDLRSDVDVTERTTRFVFDHYGEEVDLDTATNGWVLRQKSIFSTNGTDVVEEYFYYETNGLLYTKEVTEETDPQAEDALQGDHVKYYFLEEDAGDGYGRIYRVDNYTEGWYYDISYANPSDPNDDTISSKLTRDLTTDEIIVVEEKWPSDRIKRIKTEEDVNGDYLVTEYLDENWASQGYGRVDLSYDSSYPVYNTYDWQQPASGQVTVVEYSGVYTVFPGDELRAGVYTAHKTAEYIYDHHNEQVDLDVSTNGWTIRQKAIYTTGGLLVTEIYDYATDGTLTTLTRLASDGTADSIETYEYFATSGRLEKKTVYSRTTSGDPAQIGQEPYVMYTFYDESFYDNGTPLDDSDDYGRLEYLREQTTSTEWTEYHYIEYWTGTDDVKIYEEYDNTGTKIRYELDQDGNIVKKETYISDVLSMVEDYYTDTFLIMARTYLNGTSDNGNVFYHYLNEAFYDNGTTDDASDDYGRVDMQVADTLDADGAIAYESDYSTSAGAEERLTEKRAYASADYSNTANPVFSGLVATYNYYTTDSDNRIHTKLIESVSGGEYDGKRIRYYYLNEDAGDGYGRVYRMDNLTDGWYEEYTYANPSDPNDERRSSSYRYDLSDDSLIFGESYYADTGLLHERTYEDADSYGNDYYEYENYDYYGNGTSGRVIRNRNASSGYVYKVISFHTGTDRRNEVNEYTDLTEDTLWNVYWFYDDATGRMYRKISYNDTYGDNGVAYQYRNNSDNRCEIKWDLDGSIYGFYDEDGWHCEWRVWDADLNDGILDELDQFTGYGFFTEDPDQYHYKNMYAHRDGTDDTWDWTGTEILNNASGSSKSYVWAPASPPSGSGVTDPYTLDLSDMEAPVATDPTKLLDAGLKDNLTSDDIISPEIELFYQNLDALKAVSAGKDVTVAILDSGINADAFDFNVSTWKDFTGSGDISDELGHGTTTAGIIAGTAPEADILVAKVLDEEGNTTSSIMSEAIRYAVDMGARVLAMPLNLYPVYNQLEQAIDYATGKGAVLVAAAGNEGTKIHQNSLAGQDKVLTVGSVDNDGELSAWSNNDDELDLVAPWDIIDNEEGTSFSAAFVAGITSLIISENPDITPEEILEALRDITASLTETTSAEEKKAGEKAEEEKKKKIKGVDIEEVLSRYNAERKNASEFTGYSVKEDIPELIVKD
ncbi:MAG: S8 family serine peptidase, partial [Candidatus Omnitrophica bacterium]|nr:S8 family serine peptidase [Candidatus Omnitrophota bacterium]